MSDKKRSAKRKWKNALLAAALTASVILTLPAWSVRPAEATTAGTPGTTSKTYVEQNSTLTIKRAGANPEKQGKIVVDLYKVATAKKKPNYDAYELEMDNALLSLYGADEAEKKEKESIIGLLEDAQGPSVTVDTKPDNNGHGAYVYNEAYRDLAQAVARKVLTVDAGSVSGNDVIGKGVKVDSQSIDGKGTAEFKNLAPGMYLVIAHGDGLAPGRYVSEKDGQIVTKAYTDGYNYTYLPELISLPMRIDDKTTPNAPQGAFSTAQSAGDWRYAVTAELKAEMEVQMSDVTITKTFDVPAGMTLPGNDGCIFQIDAVLNDRTVFSKVVTISYGGSHTITLEDVIPEGATVTVNEIYDGASFDIAEGQTKLRTVAKDDNGVYSVSFTDTYNGTGTGGGIVENRFTRNNGSYTHNAVSDSDINPVNPQ